MGSSDIQGKLWGAEPENYTEINEPINKSLWEVMLASPKVGEDTRFLDAGCGAGGACVLAAGLGAKVTGLDASEALINIARQRVPILKMIRLEGLKVKISSIVQFGGIQGYQGNNS